MKHNTKTVQLINLLAQGMSAKEIAPIIGLTQKSCETFRHRVIKRFDAKNGANLVLIAAKRGILEV